MSINLSKDTTEGWRAYIHEKIKEVKENMSIKYWHESNQFCRDWWDSIEENDYMAFAKVKLGCVEIEARIDRYNSAATTISYYLNIRNKNIEWEELECITPDHIEFISKVKTWDELFNDMLYNLIEYCIEYEIDYEAKNWCIKDDLLSILSTKLNDEFKSYTKYLKDNCVDADEIISYHYVITMKHEFRKAINELAKKMTPKEIRQKFLEKDDILENLFQKFIKKETGEMDIYKEFVLNAIKEEQ